KAAQAEILATLEFARPFSIQCEPASGPRLANDAHERVGEPPLLAVCSLRQGTCIRDLRHYRLHLLCGGLLRHGALLRCAESSEHHCRPVEYHAVCTCRSGASIYAKLCLHPGAGCRLCTASAGLWLARAAFARTA